MQTNDDSRSEAADDVASDRLGSAEEIGRFIGEPPRRVYYLAAEKLIPVGKMGRGLIGSKRVLRAHYEKLARGEGISQ